MGEQSVSGQPGETPDAGHDGGMRGFDVPDALRRLRGNQRLLRKLAGDFVREFSGMAGTIGEALARGERDTARAIAHTLGGVASTLAARDVHVATVALERALASGAPARDELDALAAALGALYVP